MEALLGELPPTPLPTHLRPNWQHPELHSSLGTFGAALAAMEVLMEAKAGTLKDPKPNFHLWVEPRLVAMCPGAVPPPTNHVLLTNKVLLINDTLFTNDVLLINDVLLTAQAWD